MIPHTKKYEIHQMINYVHNWFTHKVPIIVIISLMIIICISYVNSKFEVYGTVIWIYTLDEYLSFICCAYVILYIFNIIYRKASLLCYNFVFRFDHCLNLHVRWNYKYCIMNVSLENNILCFSLYLKYLNFILYINAISY